jgi:hypothetical protein
VVLAHVPTLACARVCAWRDGRVFAREMHAGTLSKDQRHSYTKLIHSGTGRYVVPMRDPVAVLAKGCDAIVWSREGEAYGKFTDEETGTTFCVLEAASLASVREEAARLLDVDRCALFAKEKGSEYESLARKALKAGPDAAKALLESEYDALSEWAPRLIEKLMVAASPVAPRKPAVAPVSAPLVLTNKFALLAPEEVAEKASEVRAWRRVSTGSPARRVVCGVGARSCC